MKISERFREIGEYGAAGMYEQEDRSLFYRKALGIRRYYENCSLPEYCKNALYPSGIITHETAVFPDYREGMAIDVGGIEKRTASLPAYLPPIFAGLSQQCRRNTALQAICTHIPCRTTSAF